MPRDGRQQLSKVTSIQLRRPTDIQVTQACPLSGSQSKMRTRARCKLSTHKVLFNTSTINNKVRKVHQDTCLTLAPPGFQSVFWPERAVKSAAPSPSRVTVQCHTVGQPPCLLQDHGPAILHYLVNILMPSIYVLFFNIAFLLTVILRGRGGPNYQVHHY
jgi:hypothetical protein